MSTPLLGPEASLSCPVTTAHQVVGKPAVPEAPVPAEEQWREHVFAAFAASLGSMCARIVGPDRIAQTMAAMDDHRRVILGGELPPDHAGGRRGEPDLLVRVGNGYLPGLIRHQVSLDEASHASVRVSTLQRPWEPLQDLGQRAHHRSENLFELAHLTRMLEACARHAGPYIGFVVGTSQHNGTSGPRPVLVWTDLTRTAARDLVRAPGALDDSALAQYDREHETRIEVARAIAEGRPIDEEAFPLVQTEPVWHDDCEQCSYGHHCRSELGEDDASVALTSAPFDVQDWAGLHRRGIRTVEQVAAIDLDDTEFVADYVAEMTHTSVERSAKALALTVARARMLRNGALFERRTEGPLEVPTADVEIDIDIDWDTQGRVFLWGARVRYGQDEQTAHYRREFITYDRLDDAGERALAARYVDWLRGLVTEEESAGRSVSVFFWSYVEVAHLRRLLGDAAVEDLVGEGGVYVDLRGFLQREFDSIGDGDVVQMARRLGVPVVRPGAKDPNHDMPLDADVGRISAAIRDALRRRYPAE